MKILLSADIHLSRSLDHAYRWQAMKQLAKHAARDDVAATVIAGDLVHVKDRHPASFVQRLVASVKELAAVGKLVFIMKGNHDYFEATCPFFEFLREIKNVVYVTEPEAFLVNDQYPILLIPHVKAWGPGSAWRKDFPLDDDYNVIICHQTFGGAKASNGFHLDGVPLSTVSRKRTGGTRVLAGDIHVPQKIGNVTYIGSPHPVAFGDTFEPGFVLWDLEEEKVTRIKRTTIRRLVMNYEGRDECSIIPVDADLVPREGDHVMFRYHGPREQAGVWPEIRRAFLEEAEKTGFQVFGSEFIVTREKKMPTSSRELFDDDVETPESDDEEFELFCRESKVPNAYLDTGRELLGKSSEREWSSRETEFRSISFEGFRSFQKETVMELPKTPGVYLITGENQVEPELGANGVGKSSFADGLCWGVFGKTSKGHRAKEVGNWTGENLTSVIINFSDECGDNTITRRWNPNALIHQLEDGEPKTIEQHDVERILGLNYKLFLATVLFSQSGGPDKKDSPGKHFMELGSTAQAEALSDVLNLSVWEQRAKQANTKAKAFREEGGASDREVLGLKAEKKVLVEQRNALCEKEDSWQDEQDKSARELLGLLERAKETQGEALTAKEKSSRPRVVPDKQKKKLLRELTKECSVKTARGNTLRLYEVEIKTKLRLKRKEKDEQKELVDLGRGTCPLCSQGLDPANIHHNFDVIENEFSDLKVDLKETQSQIEQVADDVAAVSAREGQLASEIEDEDDRCFEVNNWYRQCVEAYQRAVDDTHAVEIEIENLKKVLNPHTDTVDKLEVKIKNASKALKTFQKEQKLAELQADRAGYWAQGFLRIRLWLLERAMCEFEAKMLNSFDLLGLKGWGVSCNTEKTLKGGGVKPALTILVSSPESPEPVPWGVWSGGEEQRLKVAGSAAFSDLVCDRMGVRPSLEIWDEPTQHLSPEGCDDLMEFLGHRARMLKKQIWVIDHRTTASGEVDGHWHFTKNEYGTHIKELR